MFNKSVVIVIVIVIVICDLLSWHHPNRSLRSANRISPVPHCHKTVKLSRRLMDTAAATLWNDLPDNIRNCDNTWTFKKPLKTSILTTTCYLITLLYSVQTHNVYIHCIVSPFCLHQSFAIPYLYFFIYIYICYI